MREGFLKVGLICIVIMSEALCLVYMCEVYAVEAEEIWNIAIFILINLN